MLFMSISVIIFQNRNIMYKTKVDIKHLVNTLYLLVAITKMFSTAHQDASNQDKTYALLSITKTLV